VRLPHFHRSKKLLTQLCQQLTGVQGGTIHLVERRFTQSDSLWISGHKSPCRSRFPYKQDGEVCFCDLLKSTHSGLDGRGPAVYESVLVDDFKLLVAILDIESALYGEQVAYQEGKRKLTASYGS